MAEIFVYGEITPEGFWGFSCADLLAGLEPLGENDPVTVRINSPGGDVVEAIAMHNAIARWKGKVTMEIDSQAASAASLFAMSGNEIRIAENAEMMIHEPYVFTAVNFPGIEFLSERLGDYRTRTADMYAARSGRTRDEIIAAYNGWDGTYFNAAEAVEFGMADSIGQKLTVAATDKCRTWQLAGREAPKPESADRIIRDLRHRQRQLQLAKLRA